MQDTLRFKIQKKYNELRPSEKKVADYFLDRNNDNNNLTLKQLEEKTSVSQPSVMRFVKAIGFTTFKAFKIALITDKAKYPSKEEILYGFEIDEKDQGLSSRIISTNIKMLEEALKSISQKQLDETINAITQAKQVAIFAVENSISIAQDLLTKLIYLGINVCFYEDNYLQSLLANNLKEGDVAIGISYSGNSNSTIEVLKRAKRNNAKTIAITNFAQSSIQQYGDHVICTSNDQFLYGDAIYSRCTQMAVVDMIYMGIIMADYEHFTTHLDESRKLILKRGLDRGNM